jgi:hypothetical protein
MEEFPFTSDEWHRVTIATGAVLNATLTDDPTLRSSAFLGLQDVLAELRQIHGDHPVLLETEADFSDDATSRRALYLEAIQLATQHGHPTRSMRLALTVLLLSGFHDRAAAAAQLEACKQEFPLMDNDEKQQWFKLLDQFRKLP